jgi:hypothetical protein
MADGSIRIETKLDNSALKRQVKELERELNHVRKEQAKVDAQADSVRAKHDAEREFDAQFPEEFSQRKEIDEKAQKELDPIIAKQDELNQKEQLYLEKLEAVNAKLAEQASLASASKQVDSEVRADNTVSKVKNQAEYNSLLDATAAKMAAIEAAASRVATQTGLTKDQILAANPEYQKLSDTMSLLKSKAGEFGDEAKTAGKKAQSGLRKAKKEANGFGSAITKGIKKLGRMGLAVLGIRGAYSAVRMAMTEYLATNEQLAGQLNTLKAGFGQILGPAIEWVVNLLFKAVGAVNSFVYALTGINFAAKANEAALKKQAKATGAAAKATNQLAGFDEQTKLSDTSGGGGGGSSGNPVALIDATVGALSGLAEKLKNQILDGDWFGAGQTVGQALMDGIAKIDWNSVGSTIGEILWGAVAFMFGLAVSIDAETIFTAVNELLTGFFTAMSTGIQSLDWNQIGRELLDLLLIAIGVLNPAVGILELMLAPGGKEMTKSASEFVGSVIGALASAIVGLSTKIGELALQLWEAIKNHFDDYVDWEGTPEDIIKGLWNGIVDALKNVGRWIYDNIWVPFRDGFKKAFGINSPSTKMKEFGGYMIDGLRNGLTGGISKIVSACQQIWTSIKNVFSSVGTWFQTTFSNAWQKVKNVFSSGGKIFDGIKDGISSTFKTIVNKLIDGINKIIATPFNKINSMLNTIRSIKVAGAQPFKNLWKHNPLSVPKIPKLARGGIVNRPGRGVPAIIGEAGREAVLPLDNHTEWMDILADKIGNSGGNVTIPIYLDGKKIYTYMVDIGKRKAFAANGG